MPNPLEQIESAVTPSRNAQSALPHDFTRTTLRQKFALATLKLFGWKVGFAPLPGPRGVIIFYPHTSNWDFVLGILAKASLGLSLHFMSKESLFRGPVGWILGRFLRSVGGEPVNRVRATGATTQMVARMRQADRFWLALSPEGTRCRKDGWRSGFYQIARAANVPLGLAYVDRRTKEIGLTTYLELTGVPDLDAEKIRQFYQGREGLRPHLASPIVWRCEAPTSAAGTPRRADP